MAGQGGDPTPSSRASPWETQGQWGLGWTSGMEGAACGWQSDLAQTLLQQWRDSSPSSVLLRGHGGDRCPTRSLSPGDLPQLAASR